jgi:hypothetical protein
MTYRARAWLSVACGLLAAVAFLPFLFGGEEAKIRAALEHGAEAVEEADLDTTASMISPTYSGRIGIDRDQGVAFAEWFYRFSRKRRISLEAIDVKVDGERAQATCRFKIDCLMRTWGWHESVPIWTLPGRTRDQIDVAEVDLIKTGGQWLIDGFDITTLPRWHD